MLEPVRKGNTTPRFPSWVLVHWTEPKGLVPFSDTLAVVQRPQGRRGWAAGLTCSTLPTPSVILTGLPLYAAELTFGPPAK